MQLTSEYNEKQNVKLLFMKSILSEIHLKYRTIFECNEKIYQLFLSIRTTVNKNFKESDISLLANGVIGLDTALCQWNLNGFLLNALKSSVAELRIDLRIFLNFLYNFDYFYRYKIFIPVVISKEYQPGPETFVTYPSGLPEFIKQDILSDNTFGVGYISGMDINPFYHALLFVGKAGFFHINSMSGHPTHLSIQHFNDFLARKKRKFFGVHFTDIKNTNALLEKLNELVQNNWYWGGVIHNCASFVREVLTAGGYTFNNPSELFQNFGMELPSEIFQTTPEPQFIKRITEDDVIFPPIDRLKYQDITTLSLNEFGPAKKINTIFYFLNNFSEICTQQERFFFQKKSLYNFSEQHISITCWCVANKLSELTENIVAHFWQYTMFLYNPEAMLASLSKLLKFLKGLRAHNREMNRGEEKSSMVLSAKAIEQSIREILSSAIPPVENHEENEREGRLPMSGTDLLAQNTTRVRKSP